MIFRDVQVKHNIKLQGQLLVHSSQTSPCTRNQASKKILPTIYFHSYLLYSEHKASGQEMEIEFDLYCTYTNTPSTVPQNFSTITAKNEEKLPVMAGLAFISELICSRETGWNATDYESTCRKLKTDTINL